MKWSFLVQIRLFSWFSFGLPTHVTGSFLEHFLWNCSHVNMQPITFEDMSTLIQVMDRCRQATSHYLSQSWPRFVLLYGVATKTHWVIVNSYWISGIIFTRENYCYITSIVIAHPPRTMVKTTQIKTQLNQREWCAYCLGYTPLVAD